MNVNELDDDALILILKQFTTQELLGLRAVCGRWQSIIEQICSGKRSLKLFSSFDNVYQYCNDLINFCQEDVGHLKLQLPPMDDDIVLALEKVEVCHFLGEIFTGVESLVVHLDALSAANLPTLIQRFPGLLRLSIFGDLPSWESLPTEFAYQQQLSIAIGSLASLKHLELFKEPNYSTHKSLGFSLECNQTLAKLESFALIGFEGDVVQILGQLGSTLKRLTVDRLPLSHLEQLQQANAQFGSSLTHLSVEDLNLEALQYICEHFKALECLEIGLDDVKIFDIATALLRLPALSELKFKTFGVDQLDPSQIDSLPSLPAIKSLTIFKLNIFSHSTSGPNYLCQTLSILFPAVEAINLRNENARHTPAVLAGINKDNLSEGELGYLERYQIYSTAEMLHIGRHRERCKTEKTNRGQRMWDYEQTAAFDHNARLARLSIGAAIQRRVDPSLGEASKSTDSK